MGAISSLFRNKEDDERELRQLTKSVRKTMSMQKREVKGIGDIVFTVGKSETTKFEKENQARHDRGEAHYERVKNDVGSKDKLVVVWIKMLSERTEFMTDLVLGSTRPKHEHFFMGDKDGFKIITHPEMRGLTASDPTFCIWFKKDAAKTRHICDIRISYTADDRKNLKNKNYEMLPQCLSTFGLGYANVWILWTSCQILRLTNSDHIEKELKDYSDMLAKSPNDPILIKMVQETERRLRDIYLREEEQAKDIPGDDLVYTKQFLALSQAELHKMKSTFKNINFHQKGRISVEDFVMFLREPLTMSPFMKQIFTLSSQTNAVPILDVGSTLKATAIFCMLGCCDLLKCIFAWYDIKGFGYIENKEFLELLGIFHPKYTDDRVVRSLKNVNLPGDGTMPFSKFKDYNRKYPHLFYPAFRVQEKMREKFMGLHWWKRKLAKYEEARKQIQEKDKREEEIEYRERRQRYEVSQDLMQQVDIFEVKKKSRKRRTRNIRS